MKIEAAGEGEKATTEGVNAAGTATKTEYTAQYDGKDYPITGSQTADTVALKRIDARTIERTDKKGREGGGDLEPSRLRGREDDDRHDHRHERAGAGHEQRHGLGKAVALGGVLPSPPCRMEVTGSGHFHPRVSHGTCGGERPKGRHAQDASHKQIHRRSPF